MPSVNSFSCPPRSVSRTRLNSFGSYALSLKNAHGREQLEQVPEDEIPDRQRVRVRREDHLDPARAGTPPRRCSPAPRRRGPPPSAAAPWPAAARSPSCRSAPPARPPAASAPSNPASPDPTSITSHRSRNQANGLASDPSLTTTTNRAASLMPRLVADPPPD